MLSIATGYSVDYLTNEVAAGRENYYTGAVAEGEPPGRWHGAGAAALGLSGLVDHQDMTALYEHYIDPRDAAFKDPERWGEAATLGHTGRRYRSEEQLYAEALEREPNASPERRTELLLDAGKRAQRNVAFLDATFSVQKSVTVLHTAFEAQEVNARTADNMEAADAWGWHRQAVEDAMWAGNQAALDYLADHAGYSRIGHHGGATGRFIDAHDLTVASFFQHDNRDHDPQLHIHNAILNRVQGVDGEWRTVDSRALHKFRGAAAAVGERTMEEHLTRALGVQFATRPDGKSREVVGIDEATMDLFSGRRRAITAKTTELVDAFETKFGRAPNSLELDRLSRQATFATRKAKSHEGETREQMLERWDAQLRAEIAGGLNVVARDVLAAAQRGPAAAEWSPSAVIETALADVQSKKAAWAAPDLTRAISDALPDHLGTRTGVEMTELLDSLTHKGLEVAVPLDAARPGDESLPDSLRLTNGNSAYEAPGRRLYATPGHVHTERVLTAAATDGGAAAMSTESTARFAEALGELGIELSADQAAAVRGVLTSGARVESLVGPAGTGKSFVVGALAKAWTDHDTWTEPGSHRVFGLASSQIATDVLAGEGVEARNVTRWLATQQRLADGGTGGDDELWKLHAGDLVVVDESAMTNTTDLAAIHDRARAAGAKLLLVGDHKQLAAVGAGGGMDMLATAGAAYELTDARRFAEDWERDASLRLRAGDETVLDTYHRHGRLIDGGAIEQTEQSATRAWLGDTLAGKRSILLVDTNEQAARLSAEVRAELVRLGKVTETGVPLGMQGTYAGVGDLVQARRNDWSLAGYRGNTRCPINRETYRVTATNTDGSLVVAPILGRDSETGEQLGDSMTLPATYASEHLALGYASTVHAAQGVTVDTSHSVITPATGPEALYVGMTRGRETNTAHVTTRAVSAPDAPTGTVNTDAVYRAPAAVLAGSLETADPTKSALAVATESREDTESVRTPAELLADAIELATAGRTSTWLDQLTDDGTLTPQQCARIAAEDGGATLTRVLRRAELAGHDPYAVLTAAVGDRELTDARQLTNVLYNRIVTGWTLDPAGDNYTDRLPTVDDAEWARYLDALARDADERTTELGRLTADEEPQWAVEAFGPVPDDVEAQREWTQKAGAVAAYRELTGHEDQAEPLGAAPKPGQAEAYASWRTAWRALDRPEADRDELEMNDGQLRVRARAAERENAWAPRYVGNELAGTIQAATSHRHTAQVRAAEAANAADENRARVEREAAEAAALAETLEQRAEQLREVEQARGQWLAHTAATRAAAERATAELTARHADDHPVDDRVTAAEWLAAHREDQQTEDPHREITSETELADIAAERDDDLARALDIDLVERDNRDVEVAKPDQVEPELEANEACYNAQPARHEPTAQDESAEAVVDEPEVEYEPAQAEKPEPDIREVAELEPAEHGEDQVTVPSQDDTADAVRRAQRALAEMNARQAEDAQHERDERAEQRARWHATEQTREREQADSGRDMELS